MKYVPNRNSYNLTTSYSGYTTDQYLTTDDLNWRIYSMDSNKILLISDTKSKNTIKSSAVNMYNNLILILNEITNKLYSNSYGNARSIKFEDIEKYSNRKPAISDEYGRTETITNSKYPEIKYPNKYIEEKWSGVNSYTVKETGLEPNEQGNFATGSSEASYITIKNNVHRIYENDISDAKILEILSKHKLSSIATRNFMDSNGGKSYPAFGWYQMSSVDGIIVSAGIDCYITNTKFVGDESQGGISFYTPIIELNSNVMIDTSSPNADGETANTGWDLKFK